MSREKQLAKNTFIIAFGTFMPKLMAIISLPIITAGLTKVEYGTYDLVNILESLFLPCITLQIQTAAFRFLIECREDKKRTKEIISNLLVFVTATSLIALIILFFCLGNISSITRFIICFYFFFYIIMNSAQQIIRGINNTMLYSMSAIIQSITNVVLIIVCIKFKNMGLDGALIALAVSSFASACLLMFKGGLHKQVSIKVIKKDSLVEKLKYSLPMIPNSLSMWIMKLSDRLVLTVLIGFEANAVYAVANKIPSLFTVVQSTFTMAWQENASMASGDKDVGSYFSQMFDVIYSMLVGVMALLIAATPILFELLIKGDYEEAYYQMPILFMGVFFSCIVAFLGGIYIAHKKTKSVGITTSLAAGINLIIDLLFVKKIGIYAASISTLVSYVFLTIYRMYDIKKFEKIVFNWTKISFTQTLLIVMCILCYIRSFELNVINIVVAVSSALLLNKNLIKNIFKSVLRKLQKRG